MKLTEPYRFKNRIWLQEKFNYLNLNNKK